MTDRAPASGQANFQRANDESRQRLASLISTLTPDQLAIDLGEGWTVASALAHIGFWDRWQAARWVEMLAGRWTADDASIIAAEHLANDALHPYWGAIDATDVPALALEASNRLDALIVSAPDALIDAALASPSAYLVNRFRHRGEHLDHIERALAAAAAETPAPIDRAFIQHNAESRRHLLAIVDRLTPADLALPTEPTEEDSWTVAQTLGHLAFWDRSMEARWRAALATARDGEAVAPMGIPGPVADVINEPLAGLIGAWAEQVGLRVAAEALAAAEAVDSLLESLVDRLSEPIQEQTPAFVQRWRHRELHLEAVEKALAVPR